MNETIRYYDNNAQAFIDGTSTADMKYLLDKFAARLSVGASILDLGCGSGRDSVWFINQGFDVTAIDASVEMIRHCKSLIGDRAILADLEEFETTEKYDGIWACASLLHIPRERLAAAITKYSAVLKPGGRFFMSFKDHEQDYKKDGRIFTCFTPPSLEQYLNDLNLFNKIDIYETEDVRPDRPGERWVSAIGEA